MLKRATLSLAIAVGVIAGVALQASTAKADVSIVLSLPDGAQPWLGYAQPWLDYAQSWHDNHGFEPEDCGVSVGIPCGGHHSHKHSHGHKGHKHGH